MTVEDTGTLIIGAGPAGLGTAACLRRADHPFTIVERGESAGTSWRNHYERLHLHTVKGLSALPHRPFPPETPTYPTRAQVVAYLEDYARHFEIEPKCGIAITELARDDDHWIARSEAAEFRCERVVLATGYNARPHRPTWPGQDEFSGTIEHASSYRNGGGHRGKRVLVVGSGNTGAEIALDLVEHGAESFLCVRSPTWFVPRDILGMPSQASSVRLRGLPLGARDAIARTVSKLFIGDLSRWGIHRPSTGPITMIEHEGRVPIIDVGTVAKIKDGSIQVVPGIERFDGDAVVFVDGRRETIDHVVLATGYGSGLANWVEGIEPHLDAHGYPNPRTGALGLPGLFVVGFQETSTGLLRQIALDATQVADAVIASARPAPT